MVSTYGVLQKWAAKMEGKTLAEGEVAARPDTDAVKTRRYYFYKTETENAIDFMNLNEILSKKGHPDKRKTIDLLQGGYTSPATKSADYFKWLAVAIRTNKYDPTRRTFVVYTCRLNMYGQKERGSEEILPYGSPVTTETFEADHNLFKNVLGNSDVIQLDNSEDSMYVNGNVPPNFGKMLLNNVGWNGLKYDDFVKDTFGKYRIWVPNMLSLYQPDHTESKTDMLKEGRGNYTGGDAAFKKEVEPYIKSLEDEENAPTTARHTTDEKGALDKLFKPGTTSVNPTKGNIVDQGDTALREAAKRVVAAITSNSPGLSGSGKIRTPIVPISANPRINEQLGKKITQYAKAQKTLLDGINRQLGLSKGTTSTTTSTTSTGKFN